MREVRVRVGRGGRCARAPLPTLRRPLPPEVSKREGVRRAGGAERRLGRRQRRRREIQCFRAGQRRRRTSCRGALARGQAPVPRRGPRPRRGRLEFWRSAAEAELAEARNVTTRGREPLWRRRHLLHRAGALLLPARRLPPPRPTAPARPRLLYYWGWTRGGGWTTRSGLEQPIAGARNYCTIGDGGVEYNIQAWSVSLKSQNP